MCVYGTLATIQTEITIHVYMSNLGIFFFHFDALISEFVYTIRGHFRDFKNNWKKT